MSEQWAIAIVGIVFTILQGLVGVLALLVWRQNNQAHRHLTNAVKDAAEASIVATTAVTNALTEEAKTRRMELDAMRQSLEREAERRNADAAEFRKTLEAERETRHQFHREQEARLWALNSDLKENYELRRDAMRLYGTLTQNQNKNQRELLERIDTLPCHAPACPGEKK